LAVSIFTTCSREQAASRWADSIGLRDGWLRMFDEVEFKGGVCAACEETQRDQQPCAATKMVQLLRTGV